MTDRGFVTMERQALEMRLKETGPDNEGRKSGFALVNVLGRDQFEKAHIPNSINIPREKIEEFEKRFDKDKEIVVYCASPDCDASPKAAAELVERGFTNVLDYENGLSDWKQAGDPVEGREAA